MTSIPRASSRGGGTVTMMISRIALVLAANMPRMHSRPTTMPPAAGVFDDEEGESPSEHGFWIYCGVALFLVLMGGIFAGLTLGLMGQDEIYLQVIEQSGDGAEKKHAKKVLKLLKRGKHWVLVTLLLSNVITNETLPIVLDRSLGGGWPAVLSSTILIVIFGEIIPQSVCVRYGLSIGAYLSPFVLGLMYLMYPVAYPTALLLDYILGEDHGTVYKKAGLKTLVTLHKTLGPSPSERLNQDEVTIISAVLDLKDKPVGSIMTPIKDVFTMSSDTVLDEKTMDRILSAGYSRIPIHSPSEPTNFVGMLLVKILITYDPEDGKKVGEFPLATLPETREETSCLDIVNFFQEGKSHMVLVSENPGENHGALGVVTLEDVIEELIGEEIIDESDVFIDVHKAIRRINPSPLSRRSIPTHFLPRNPDSVAAAAVAAAVVGVDISGSPSNKDDSHFRIVDDLSSSPKNDGTLHPDAALRKASIRGSSAVPEEVMAHLKHLGPSNLASNPKQTKSKTVKIKPGSQDDHIRVPLPPGSGVGQVLAQHTHNLLNNNENRNDTNANNNNTYGSTSNSNGTQRTGGTEDLTLAANNSSRERLISPTSVRVKRVARSGSLVERIEEVDGVHKTVIETTSSESENEDAATDDSSSGKKKKGGSSERSPLLGWVK